MGARSEDANDGLAPELRRLEERMARELERLGAAQSEQPESFPGLVIPAGEVAQALAELRRGDGDEPFDVESLRPLSPRLDAARVRTGLDHAQRTFGLSPFERDLLLLASCVELDLRYARIVAYLNDHMERTRPTLGLALRLFGIGSGARIAALSACRPEGTLARFGLLDLEGDGPLPTRALRVPGEVWPRLLSPSPALAPEDARLPVARDAPKLDELVLSPTVLAEARAAADWLRSADERALLVLRGPHGSGREALAGALAGELGRPVVRLERSALGDASLHGALRRELRWFAAALVVLDAEREGEPPASLPTDLPAPVIWITSSAGLERLSSDRPMRTLELARPGRVERLAIWERALPVVERAPELRLGEIAASFRFGPARIFTAAALARSRGAAAASGDLAECQVRDESLRRACRELPSSELAGLAQRLPLPYAREDLVIERGLRHELDLVNAWATHGQRVFGEWGLERRIPSARGLACLFAGPPGTGKTMAAQVLARELGLEVFRVDLSMVVDKYIGETEKKLARLFDEAGSAGAILFFDEADSLFGKRSEVKDSHDRYANIEVGYLLQRLEDHEGITILATNLKRNLDEAFQRRLHVIADFPMPAAEHRMEIWSRHLPEPCADDVDLELLSRRFETSGGDIRNAVLAAALLAAEQGSLVGMRHLVRGLSRELRKSGRIVEASAFGPWAAEHRGRGPA